MNRDERKICMRKIRWGLLGAGVLLERWMKGFRQVEDAEIAAIASRTPETARRMADRLVPSIVLRKFNSGYNRLATSDLDGRLASRLQCTCLGLDTRRTVRYRPAGGFSPLFLEKQVTRL